MPVTKTEIKIVDVADLKPLKGNAKKHPSWQIEKLVTSMQTSKEVEPHLSQNLVVDEELTVIWGNGRFQAIGPENLNWQKVQVHQKFGLTDMEKRALAILDNKSISTEWDETILATELPLLAEQSLETGFSEKEIKELLIKMQPEEELPQEAAFDMTPRLYEKYNYILLFFKNELDFLYASQLFELKKMRDRMKPNKVGLYRGIDGMKAIELISKSKNIKHLSEPIEGIPNIEEKL